MPFRRMFSFFGLNCFGAGIGQKKVKWAGGCPLNEESGIVIVVPESKPQRENFETEINRPNYRGINAKLVPLFSGLNGLPSHCKNSYQKSKNML